MKLDRLIGILSVLLQKDRATAAELSEKFEVSLRTIYRDFDSLARAGIPIFSVQGSGGGFSIMDGYKLDRTLLSSSELSAILAGLKSLDSISGTNRYRLLMDKLGVDNDTFSYDSGSIIIDLSGWDKSVISDKFELIKEAIEKKKKIAFSYCSPGGDSKRTIEPYHLIFQWSSWYVWGFCDKRLDYRMFKLSRITDLRFTGDFCEKRDVPEYSCDKLLHTRGGAETVVKFDESVKWRIIDEFGTELPEFKENGDILMKFTWSDVPDFFRYILTFGDCAEILSPEEYRRDFAELLKKTGQKYK